MPEVPDDAVQAAMAAHAEIVAGTETLSGEEVVTRLLEAAAPLLADHASRAVLAHMEAHGPQVPASRRSWWRRHFRIAAQVAAGAFSTREDQLREAAKALADGNYIACTEGSADQ